MDANPLGKVPCLVMEGGEAIFDSRVIVEYVDTLSPVGKLIPLGGRERVEIRTWEALADGLLDAAVLARMEQTWPGRTDAQRCPAWIDRQLEKVHASLKAMSLGLGDRPWCAAGNNHHTLADIAVGCALGYLDFRFPQIDWREDYPNLGKLYESSRNARASSTPRHLRRERPQGLHLREKRNRLAPGSNTVRTLAAAKAPCLARPTTARPVWHSATGLTAAGYRSLTRAAKCGRP